MSRQIIAQAAAEAKARRPAGGDRGDRPGRQCARGLPHDRRARPPRTITAAPNGDEHRRAGPRRPGRRPAAIAKAITGAYLSSGGNAFSTRTASRSCSSISRPAPTHGRARKRAAVRRAVQPAALFRPRRRASWRGGAARADRAQALAARPGGRSGRLPALQERRAGRRRRRDGGRRLRLRPQCPRRRQRRRGSDRARRHASGFEAPTAIRADQINVDGTQLRYSRRDLCRAVDKLGARELSPPSTPALGSLVAVTRLLRRRARSSPARLWQRSLGHPPVDRGRILQPRRLCPDRRRRHQPLPDPRRHRRAAMSHSR